MKKISSSLIIIFCLLSTVSQSQNPIWTAVFQGAGDNDDRFNKIISDGAGHFVGVGYTVKEGNYRDMLVVKFDAAGDTLWWRTKNGKGNGDDEGISVGVDGSGNVFATGYSDGGAEGNNILTIKFDSNGNDLWDTTWNSPAYFFDDVPVDLKIDGSGNCIVGGNAEPDTFSGSSDYITLKYATTGALVWSQQFSRPGVSNGKDELAGIGVDAGDNVYITGRSYNGTNDDFVTLRYDAANGNQAWLQSYNAGGNDRATALVVDHMGDVIVTGRFNNGSNDDIRTIKYNPAGLLQWTKAYSSPGDNDRPTAITVDPLDYVIIAAESDIISGTGSNYDFLTVRYDSTGTLKWGLSVGSNVGQDDMPTSVVTDENGNIFVTGKTDQNPATGTSDNDFMTIMRDPSGALQWGGTPLYHHGSKPGGDDGGASVIVDGTDIYVAGVSIDSVTQKDATVIKYDIATGNRTWVRNYNGKGDYSESARAIVVDANDNSYTAGYTYNENNNHDACITKVDIVGDTLCWYKYQGIKGDDDEFNSLAIASNGIIYAVGYTKVSGQKSNGLLVKWDPGTCDTVWTRTYNFIDQSDKFDYVVLDGAGNIYVTGRSDANPIDSAENNDIITMKFDNSGAQQWFKRYDGTGTLRDEPSRIILDHGGNVLVSGRTENSHDDDYIVLKYNSSNGSEVWTTPALRGFGSGNDDRTLDVAVDDSDNIYVCGYSQYTGVNADQDPIVAKFDSSGFFMDSAPLQGAPKDEATRIAFDQTGNFYVLYKYDTPGVPVNYDYYLKKFDATLTPVWATPVLYDDPINLEESPADLIISPAGDIYITGSSENDTNAGRINKNWVTIGYNPAGAQIFYNNFDGPNATDDSPNALAIHNGKLWVAGNTEGINNNQKDITINNYDLTIGINDDIVSSSAIVYPNPFSNDCVLSLKNPVNSASLEVFDMLGNLAMPAKSFNGISTRISKGNLSSGIYVYRIRGNDKSVIAQGRLVVN